MFIKYTLFFAFHSSLQFDERIEGEDAFSGEDKKNN